MGRVFFLIICLLGIHLQIFSQPYSIPDEVKRIVFIGNSITYQGRFVEIIDAYFAIHYPAKHYEIINVGLPSETVSGLSEPDHAKGKFPRPDVRERLKRVLAETKPDLVFSCYGMNDGIYLPFSESRFKKFKKGIDWLDRKVNNYGSDIIHITPPIFDERKGEAYANVLDIYTDWLISKRYTEQWKVIDIHWPMKKQLEEERLADDDFVFSKDGIHPNAAGHFVMAKYILLNLGETSLSDTSDMDDLFASHHKGTETLALVQQRQRMMKDAWLTLTGHKRPNMKKGLPMNEAMEKLKEINGEIQLLISGR